MNFLQIVQLILTLAPAGVTVTQEIITLIQSIEAAVAAAPKSHQAAVSTALAAHFAKSGVKEEVPPVTVGPVDWPAKIS